MATGIQPEAVATQGGVVRHGPYPELTWQGVLVGYLLGYWGARLSRISESDCRTVAIEVGMQNGGMGTALAIDVLHSPNAALGPAIFGTWMNISGSVLASWWRDRIPRDQQGPGAGQETEIRATQPVET